MDDDEDDFYGNGADHPASAALASSGDDGLGQVTLKDEDMMSDEEAKIQVGNESDEGDGDDDDDDDDDDVLFTLEKPQGANTEPSKPSLRTEVTPHEPSTIAKNLNPIKDEPSVKREPQPRHASATPGSVLKGTLVYNGKEGKDFPEIRNGRIDVNADPIWPGNGKPILDLDIDADLAEHSKPWRITGTDQTDYFNYGFDEYTWTMYCLKQKEMRGIIDEQKASEQQMKAALGIGDKAVGAPGNMMGMSGPGGPMGGMPDMFNPEQMMQQMMAQGVNPANMDFNQFMQMAGHMAGPGMLGPNAAQGNLGGFGPAQNSASPVPTNGQGFQPPSGPAGHQGQIQGNGMEGYSQQQMAIMQEQQGFAPGGPARRGGRRGRGYH